MSHPGAVRNFESTVRGLAARGHRVHLAYDRGTKDSLPGLWDLADSLVSEHAGVSHGHHPQPRAADRARVSGRLRAALDCIRYLGPEFDDAPKLRRRALRWVPLRLGTLLAHAPAPARSAARAALARAARAVPVNGWVTRYLREQEPDVVLLTPLLEPGSVQVEFLRAAGRLGIPTCLCVASWDNLTNKGLIHELPDRVAVWNDMQAREAVELHAVPAERVVVTGAAAYDHWFGWAPSRSREEFAADAGLDPRRPFVLYVGSSGFIAPDEGEFLVEWVAELRRHGLPDVQVLARPHPLNPLGGGVEGVRVWPAAGANPTTRAARDDYYDSLYHASAVVGVNTSAFLEAAILGRPVFAVPPSRYAETQTGAPHFRHLLTAGGGLLTPAATYEEHAAQLRAALAAPQSDRSLAFAEAFIRPYGIDEPATPRMVAAIEELVRGEEEDERALQPGAVALRAAR